MAPAVVGPQRLAVRALLRHAAQRGLPCSRRRRRLLRLLCRVLDHAAHVRTHVRLAPAALRILIEVGVRPRRRGHRALSAGRAGMQQMRTPHARGAHSHPAIAGAYKSPQHMPFKAFAHAPGAVAWPPVGVGIATSSAAASLQIIRVHPLADGRDCAVRVPPHNICCSSSGAVVTTGQSWAPSHRAQSLQ